MFRKKIAEISVGKDANKTFVKKKKYFLTEKIAKIRLTQNKPIFTNKILLVRGYFNLIFAQNHSIRFIIDLYDAIWEIMSF